MLGNMVPSVILSLRYSPPTSISNFMALERGLDSNIMSIMEHSSSSIVLVGEEGSAEMFNRIITISTAVYTWHWSAVWTQTSCRSWNIPVQVLYLCVRKEVLKCLIGSL